MRWIVDPVFTPSSSLVAHPSPFKPELDFLLSSGQRRRESVWWQTVAGHPGEARAAGRHVNVMALAELFALAGLAIAQPALDILAKNAELFVIRRATLTQALVLVTCVLFAAPLTAFLIEWFVGRVSVRARSGAHALLCGLFIETIVP